MNDVRLWFLLRAGATGDAGELAALLRDLAALDPRARVALLGLLAPALSHPEGYVRAAAVACLAGASGLPALRALVAALDDPDETVRLAAVSALAASTRDTPARYAHALFHADAGVRRAAVARSLGHADGLEIHLLADPSCREALRARLLDPAASPRIAVTGNEIGVLLDFAADGTLQGSDARALLAGIEPRSLQRALAWLPGRSFAASSEFLGQASDGRGAPPDLAGMPGDRLDDLVALFWDAAGDPMDEARGEPIDALFFRALTAATREVPGLKLRAAASIMVTAARRGTVPPTAAKACARAWADFVRVAWVPRETRRASLRDLYRAGDDEITHDAAWARAVLSADFFRRPSGRLDLWACGAVLHVVFESPYANFVAWFGLDEIAAAFAEDPVESAPFFTVRDNGPAGRVDLLQKLRDRSPGPHGFMLALVVHATPTDRLDDHANLAPDEALATLCALVDLEHQPEMAVKPERAQALARPLTACLSDPLALDFLRAWLAHDHPQHAQIALSALTELARRWDADTMVALCTQLDLEPLRRLLRAMAFCPGMPYGKEVALAHALRASTDPEVRAWCDARVPPEGATTMAPPPPVEPALNASGALARLDDATLNAIATCAEPDLSRVLAPCLRSPAHGLTDALARRANPSAPSVAVGAALAGCTDGLRAVSTQFARFARGDAGFEERLHHEVHRAWHGRADLPPLANAWLWRWEKHALSFAEQVLPAGTTLADALARTANPPDDFLARTMWKAVASVVALWRYRDRARLAALIDALSIDMLVSALTASTGAEAAEMLITLYRSGAFGALLAPAHARVIDALPDLPQRVRDVLAPWIDATGVLARPAAPPVARDAADDALARVRGAVHPDELLPFCLGLNLRIAEEAALRLIEMREPGLERLVGLLASSDEPPALRAVIDSVPLWQAGASLDRARALTDRATLPAERRFHLALAFAERGEPELLARAIAAAAEPAEYTWFRSADWDRLVRLGAAPDALALALVTSPHPNAHARAVERVIARINAPGTRPAAEHLAALRAFLETGTQRRVDLRVSAATALWNHADEAALPILLHRLLTLDSARADLLAPATPGAIAAAVDAALWSGRLAEEHRMVPLLRARGVDPEAAQEGLARIVLDAMHPGTQSVAQSSLLKRPARAEKLRAVAETFAWGVHVGRLLTGRKFTVEMAAGSALGYTRINESRVYVSALPILARERQGRDVVQALILHELGHQMYHRGKEAERAWESAADEGITGLFNLVLDEHLERNLRGLEAEFGDRLKRLAAYAFQHAAREVPVRTLLDALGGAALEVLSGARLGVARNDVCVRVHSGEVMATMERAGMSFARFVRALRMGLGDRHGDPRVAAGLALFRKGFRQSSQEALLATALKLREIFGAQTALAESFGSSESLGTGESEQIAHGEGLTQHDVDEEVERITSPRPRRGHDEGGGSGGGKLQINVAAEERFDEISTVVHVPYDPAARGEYSARVARHAARMRRYFSDLGVAYVNERMRVQGRRFDPSRAQAVALRSDPRMLIARKLTVRNDLYLGVLIDCSGSMAGGQNIEKAKAFGTMLADAARGMRGIDVRVFGFTDQVIYDAGDAGRCAAHSLAASGGNNDAGALWYAARDALASRRRARLLVMISDGLPTECSAQALRALAARLTRRERICCAQVAVRPLEEVCFPNYVEVREGDEDAAVRKFGTIVANLVRKALSA